MQNCCVRIRVLMRSQGVRAARLWAEGAPQAGLRGAGVWEHPKLVTWLQGREPQAAVSHGRQETSGQGKRLITRHPEDRGVLGGVKQRDYP